MKLLKAFFIVLFSLIFLAATGVYVLFTHYKKEMAEGVIETLQARYGVILEAEDINVSLFSNWPQVSVKLKTVRAASDRFKDSEFSANAVSFSFNIRELLNKQFIVQSLNINGGDIYFVKHLDTIQAPITEDTIPTQETTIEFEVKRLHLKNTHFQYVSHVGGQNLEMTFLDNTIRFSDFTDGVDAVIKGKIFVARMIFRENRGIFFDSTAVNLNLHANYFKEDKSICIRPGSTVEIEKQTYQVCANILLGENKQIGLLVKTEGIFLDEVRRIMNHHIRHSLRNYAVKGPMNASVLLVASMGRRQEPVVIISANSEHNNVLIGTSKIPYSDIAFSGKIVSLHDSMQRGDIRNATVTFSRITGKVYDFPFTAQLKVKDLRRPYIIINGKMNIDAAKVNFLKNEFELKGKANAYIRYSGLASRINKKQFLGKGMKLSADLNLMNLSYREKKRPYVYTLNGKADVTNTDITFDDLRLSTIVGNASLKGKVDNFVNYLFGFTHGFKAKLVARTDSFNLNPVLSAQKKNLAGKDTLRVTSDTTQLAATADSSAIQKTKAFMENKDSTSSFDFDVKLYADKMYFRRIYAEDADISMQYKDEVLEVRSMKLYTCDGKITGSGVIENFKRVEAEVTVKDVDVNMMFVQFENFGQQAIVSDNLHGKIHLQAKFSSMLDEQLEVIGETMSGEVRLSLKDGQLLNFEPLQKLSNFLFRNRDFNTVSFSELNETFQMRGYEMNINELEIGSNILNLYVVDGVYNFKGHSNINLLVPWSNLKRRKKDHIPTTSGIRAENAKGIKLNFSGPPNNLKVSLGHKELPGLKPSI